MICANGQVDIRVGDCRDLLRAMPDQSVNCIVTSPPYFGLRDYGTADWEGGDEGCDHYPPQEWIDKNFAASATFGGGNASQNSSGISRWYNDDGSCKCGARRIDRQIGLESSPDAFVAEMVAVFREARRVLRDDGTCWVNLGDTYNAGTSSKRKAPKTRVDVGGWMDAEIDGGARINFLGLKPKDLCGMPWRVAFALQADGWYLRQDIIWAKPNPMPESVRDRCTKAHEYVFLLTKSARYWYDADAVKEDAGTKPGATWEERKAAGAKAGNWWVSENCQNGVHGDGSAGTNLTPQDGRRNKRSVWTVATQPYSEAHFATYPPALIEPCILAGCPKGGTVLDPFGGAGTTGLVAARHHRQAILCELNPAYAEMAHKRISREWREPVAGDVEPIGGLFA